MGDTDWPVIIYLISDITPVFIDLSKQHISISTLYQLRKAEGSWRGGAGTAGRKRRGDTALPVIVAKRAVEEIFLVFSKILAKNTFQYQKIYQPRKAERRRRSPPGSPTRTRGVTPVRFKFTFYCKGSRKKF